MGDEQARLLEENASLRRRIAELEATQLQQGIALDLVREAVVVVDGEQKIVSCNAAAEVLFGVEAPRVVGRSAADVPFSQVLGIGDSETRAAPRSASVERRCRWKPEDGPAVDIECRLRTIRNEHGAVIGCVGVYVYADVAARGRVQPEPQSLLGGAAQDVDDARLAERKLRDVVTFNRMIMEASPVGVLLFRESGPCVFANKATAAIAGSSVEKLLELDFRELESYRRSGVLEAAEQALRTGELVRKEIHAVNTYGKSVWYEALLSSCAIEGEKHLLFLVYDLSARKEAEEAVRYNLERLKLALDAAHAGTWEWNLRTNENVWSDELWALYGLEPHSCQPSYEAWSRAIHPDDRSRVEQVVRAAAQAGAEVACEWRVVLRDGSLRWLMSRGRPIRTSDGTVDRYIGIALDVTEARQRAQDMALLLKSMANAFVVWRTELDADGNLSAFYFDYFNDAYERVSGLRLDQVRGKSVREVWPQTEKSWFDVYGEIARTGESKSFELFHGATQGLYSCTAYRPPHLSDRICVVFEDITERAAIHKQLESLAAQQRAILNAVPVGISLVRGRRMQWVNAEAARMLGYEIDQLQGASASVLYLNPEDFERLDRDGYPRIARGEVYSTEALFKKKDGTPVWCHMKGQAVDPRDPDSGTIWCIADTTERRAAEAALRDSEERFKRLVQHSSDIICVTDESYVVVSISESVVGTLGYEPGELLGAGELDQVHPDDAEMVTRVFAEIVKNPGTPRRIEYRRRHKAGKWVPMEVVGTNLLADSAVRGVVFNMRDVSERTRLSDQLQQAMKMEAIGRLAGGVAHDFNNLLCAISGNVELLEMDLGPTNPVRARLREVASAADRAAALTRQLLAFSRRQIIEPRVVNLNELVQELRKLLVRVIGEDIELRTVLAEELGSVRLDPGQFEQVLVNLVVNARDAMPEGGTLVLETRNIDLDAEYESLHPGVVPGPYVQLAVNDTGVGMDLHVKQRLFEPFFTTKPKGKGTGLGLATIFGAVKQAGGAVEVYSEVGKGSTFKLYFPRVDAPPERLVRAVSAVATPLGTETVLLVEDEERVRNLGRAILRRLGYTVLAAANATEALALATDHRGPIHLLMTDVVLPGMNGRELADRLCAVHPETKVLYTSGYTENVVVHHGVVDENTNFIGKPYAVGVLAAKIRRALSEP